MCQRPAGDNASDFHYRVFAMPEGVAEDPVCGSATSFAAKYWAGRMADFNKNTEGADRINSPGTFHSPLRSGSDRAMKIRAVSHRGGEVELVWDETTMRAKLRGNARVASRGEIYV